MPIAISMPQLGESVTEGTVGRWLKQVGESVEKYEPLLEVISDKVDTEITATENGTLLSIEIEEGATVPVGTVLCYLGQPGESVGRNGGSGAASSPVEEATSTPEPAPAPEPAVEPVAVAEPEPALAETAAPVTAPAPEPAAPPRAEPAPAPMSADEGVEADGGRMLTPVVARMLAEHRIDISQIPGTGGGGRVTKKDVEAFLGLRQPPGAAPSPAPVAPPAAAPAPRPVETPAPVARPVTPPPAARPATPPPATAPRPTIPPSPPAAPMARPITTPPAAPQPSPAAARPPAPAPRPAPAPAQPGDVVPLTNMRRRIAEHMVQSKRTAPHVTTVFEVDLSAVSRHRDANRKDFEARGARLTFMAYFVEATAKALRKHPLANSTFTEAGIQLFREVNIGMAAATQGGAGLLVPVVRRADEKNLLGLARDVDDLTQRARSGGLTPDDMSGGTFTISNHGVGGSLWGTPIINQPQSAILGIGKIQKRVVVTPDDAIAVRPMAYLSLTFDHRVLDGATGDAFMSEIVRLLEGYA